MPAHLAQEQQARMLARRRERARIHRDALFLSVRDGAELSGPDTGTNMARFSMPSVSMPRQRCESIMVCEDLLRSLMVWNADKMM